MKDDFDITYKALFRKYYPNLLFYATRLVGEEEAEDVVQDVFVELWKRRDSMEIGEQIQAFLYRAVYTRSLNVLKHRNIESGYIAIVEEINQKRVEFYQPDNNEVIRRIEDRELRKEIYDAINELPDKCKEVFKLSYLHDMKNRVYIGPDISKQPTLTCVQTEIRLSLLGGTAEMSAVSFFVYEPVTWLLTNRCLKIFFCRFIVHILPILIK